ncbi:MAG: BlaI/MecI/CopY family transcriptional regulator [Bryobacterales bacterium]|nr:BlaI/MecI/CopY family transcriptional regulator [Bryobacterales bacterium]
MRRPGRPSDIPPPLELACLRALWQLGEGSVKDVRGVLTGSRNLAYTTIMTVLERLARRGAVERRKRGRAFLYQPVMGREQARRLAVKELAETYFDGSVDELRRYLDRPGAPPPPPLPVQADEPVEADLDATLL